MTQPRSNLHFREVTLDDAGLVADLESAIEPDDPRDAEMMTFWWTHRFAGEEERRWIVVERGVARVFVFAGHPAWQEGATRFGSMRVRLHPDDWTESRYLDALERAESWLRDEGADATVLRVRSDLTAELAVLERLGFREDRRTRVWRLDLVKGRERLLSAAEKARAGMQKLGIHLLTLEEDDDPEKLRKVFDLDIGTMDDIPKTVPFPIPTYEEWHAMWFDNPGFRADRMWLARDGEAIVGMSAIGYPPRRGIPWTAYTCTARHVRGRGIARALKYETVAQAIALGVDCIETQNDAANAPILHLNDEMGYEPALPIIELHHHLKR